MRINSLYFIRFNERAEAFEHEMIPFDFNPINCALELWDGDWIIDESENSWDGQMKVLENIRECSKQFHIDWEKYASEEDRLFTASDVAKQAEIIKAGKYYYQFYTKDIPIDVSRNFHNLLPRYNVHIKGTERGPVYFWNVRPNRYALTAIGGLNEINAFSLEHIMLYGGTSPYDKAYDDTNIME